MVDIITRRVFLQLEKEFNFIGTNKISSNGEFWKDKEIGNASIIAKL